MRRNTHEESIEIDASSETVFNLIHDYSRRLEWDTLLKDARLLDAPAAAAGTIARCTAHNGLAMDTVYVSFNRPSVAAVRMVAGPWIFASFAATIRQEAIGERRTRVTYRYNFETRPRFLYRVVEWMFARETRKRLRALKEYARVILLTSPCIRAHRPS
jgi:Polyketide cyclase / dehydrase and lipid transport.